MEAAEIWRSPMPHELESEQRHSHSLKIRYKKSSGTIVRLPRIEKRSSFAVADVALNIVCFYEILGASTHHCFLQNQQRFIIRYAELF